jgi:hypothetical protein
MQNRTLKVAILAALTVILALSFAGVAFAAPSWSDLPDTVTAKYGITDNQVAAISDGYPGGLWKPFQNITRAQFVKMAVAAFNVDLVSPATASYTDVPSSNYYYPYIEGAHAAGMVNGTTASTFAPNANITREQAIAIVVRYVAAANGYDLATMYTPAEITALLAGFGDAASVGSALKTEVAFAIDFGITQGNDYGNLAPQALLTRIQAAAFLIRAQSMVPLAPVVPAKIELVTPDKGENLIGQPHQVTFKVTQADGSAAPSVLVDFDTLYASTYYVGNISPQAAMTDANGMVTVNLLATEPGTERVSAAVAGVAAVYTTKYWLAIDQIYTVGTQEAQNNVGTPHEWGVRVVVFGPGPRSTSETDWYNVISTKPFDPTNIKELDGIDYFDASEWSLPNYYNANNWPGQYGYKAEVAMAKDSYAPRTMAGIDVLWSIYDLPDDPKTLLTDESVVSVGNITAVDGVAITAAKTATGHTDANGFSKIKIESTVVGTTLTQAIADYAGNPYPKTLLMHNALGADVAYHDYDWESQPEELAMQVKTWIAHTLPAQGGPITPAYSAPNIGEEKTLTLTLVDVYGNPIAGREVEWFMQGVGFFQTDDLNDVSDQQGPGSIDYDTTGVDGTCTVFVKSYHPGEQIVHAKVRDKGTSGAEGTFQTYTAEVQWFDVNVVTFDDPTTTGMPTGYTDAPTWDPQDEAWAGPNGPGNVNTSNPIGTSHTFCLWAYGLKLELDGNLNDPAAQTPYIDGDVTGSAYDGIFDAKDAAYFGGILLVNPNDVKIFGATDAELESDSSYHLTGVKVDPGGKIIKSWHWATVMVQGRLIKLSYLGGLTEFDYDGDGVKEPFTGQTGIYLPLEGKMVTFKMIKAINPSIASVGSITAPTTMPVATDATGKACVTIASNVKGPERINGAVTWQGNPHSAVEAQAQKTWVAGVIAGASDLTFSIYIDGDKVADNGGAIADATLPAGVYDPVTGEIDLNSAHVEVHVQDGFGNDLPDYEVVYLLNSIGTDINSDTYVPLAYLADLDTENWLPVDANGVPTAKAKMYDMNGTRPDSNEPTPWSDPFAYIVGDGYDSSGPSGWSHRAFFFNQWLGTTAVGSFYPNATLGAGQPGVPYWPLGREYGSDIDDYYETADNYLAFQSVHPSIAPWDIDGFDGIYDNGFYDGEGGDTLIGLATDGAKAWTLDGYYDANRETDIQSLADVQPNLLTGSNIDIQLADEDLWYPDEGTNESILRVMIYAPGDGVIKEGSPVYSTQVHVLWEIPVVTTVDLTPATDYAIAGVHDIAAPGGHGEYQTVVATVKDQFGDPMVNVPVDFAGTILEGAGLSTVDVVRGTDAQGVLTDEYGNAAIEWDQAVVGAWGVESVVATADPGADDEEDSNAAVIQWVYDDTSLTDLGTTVPGPSFDPTDAMIGQTDLVQAITSTQKVTANIGIVPWAGKTLKVWVNPGGTLYGSDGPYVAASFFDVSTNTHTWLTGQPFFVSANTTVNNDGKPNWVYDLAVDVDAYGVIVGGC